MSTTDIKPICAKCGTEITNGSMSWGGSSKQYHMHCWAELHPSLAHSTASLDSRPADDVAGLIDDDQYVWQRKIKSTNADWKWVQISADQREQWIADGFEVRRLYTEAALSLLRAEADAKADNKRLTDALKLFASHLRRRSRVVPDAYAIEITRETYEKILAPLAGGRKPPAETA